MIFVATTPYAVNSFLRPHLLGLAKNYDVTLFVNTSAYPLTPDIIQAVRVEHLNIARKIRPIRDILIFHQLFKRFRDIRPSVVHSITPKAGILTMLAAWLGGVPRRFHTFTGQVWATKTGFTRFLLKRADWFITLFATQIFADSASQVCFLEDEGVVRQGSVVVFGQGSISGVDLSRFHPDIDVRSALRSELGVSDHKLVFLFVGRLVQDKGVFDLIAAFDLINVRHPNWELWMVGPDEADLQPKLQSRGDNIGARIQWLGPTFNPERYMSAADIFVLPSYREGFGSVLIEAAACGIPSIAYRIDGVIDAIVDGQTGILVDKADVHALSDAMIRLGENQNMRKVLAEAAHQRAHDHFSSAILVSAWKRFYSDALNDNHCNQ